VPTTVPGSTVLPSAQWSGSPDQRNSQAPGQATQLTATSIGPGLTQQASDRFARCPKGGGKAVHSADLIVTRLDDGLCNGPYKDTFSGWRQHVAPLVIIR
jgi:hypothetical protein